MAINAIQLGSGATMQDVMNAYNDLARQIEQANRADVKKDETGVNRVLIGKGPDNKYVVAITVVGKDVLTEITNGA